MGTKRGTMEEDTGPAASVLCCSCGMPIVPNQTMRCAQCLKAEVSIIEGISRQVVLPHCRNCDRYQRPPWTKCEPESRELLGLCLKRVRGIGKDVRLVDASFIWTEEHSKRIKVKLTVQKEVANSSVLQQTMCVEYQVVNQQCEDCQKSFTPHSFNAIVQVRQKVEHRRSFCYLEQLILKNDAHDKVLSLKETREGLDFHFAQRSHAQRFSDFVESCFPVKLRISKHLVSHDTKSNIYNYKYTMMSEICPVCVDDIVHVPKDWGMKLSGASTLMLCIKVSTAVRLINPVTMRDYSISAETFWKKPLYPVCTRSHMTEFIVLNVEPVEGHEDAFVKREGKKGGWRSKIGLADVEVARSGDFGVNDNRFIVRSHIGPSLRPGNYVLGYDMNTVNLSGLDEENTADKDDRRPDFVLVRKQFQKRRKQRMWELKRLDRDREDGAPVIDDEGDMEAMKQDLEEDPEIRAKVNLFRSADRKGVSSAAPAAAAQGEDEKDMEEDEDEDAPEVPLAELLEGLELGGDECDGPDVPAAATALPGSGSAA